MARREKAERPEGIGLPQKYSGESGNRDKITRAYTVGAVGEKGQYIRGELCHQGDVVHLTHDEAYIQQCGGVPLTEIKDDDQPQQDAA